MRITNFLLSGMFFLFAFVQLNDPDPILWVAIYSYAAILCLLAGFEKYYKVLLVAGILVSFVWAMTLVSSILISFKNYGAGSLFSFSMIKDNEVEEARESLGLLIVCSVLIWKYFEGNKKNILK